LLAVTSIPLKYTVLILIRHASQTHESNREYVSPAYCYGIFKPTENNSLFDVAA